MCRLFEDREPLEVLITLQRLCEITSGLNYMVDFAKYYWRADCEVPYKDLKAFKEGKIKNYDKVEGRVILAQPSWRKERISSSKFS
jgi:hypothetical protein